jgi:hypothetical protein
MITRKIKSKNKAIKTPGIVIGLTFDDLDRLRNERMVQIVIDGYKVGVHTISLVVGNTDTSILEALDPPRGPVIIHG